MCPVRVNDDHQFLSQPKKETSNMYHCFRKAVAVVAAAAISLAPVSPAFANKNKDKNGDTTTPIKHLVVIFGENVSFDHYFATYPIAQNPEGEPEFTAKKKTPTVNGIGLGGALAEANPNLNSGNGAGATNPFRLDRSQANTRSQSHSYGPEQAAMHGGLMDLYPANVGHAGAPPNAPPAIVLTTGVNLGYFDGNTVTALWNYAQHFALADNSFNTQYGPSTPGVLNLVSGQTNGMTGIVGQGSAQVDGGNGMTSGLTMVGDADPLGDFCSTSGNQASMGGTNIGDLLRERGISFGSFMGGFDLTITNANGSTGCNRSTFSPIVNSTVTDYVPHHSFFQYHAGTINKLHTRPANIQEIGHDGPANHNYDTNDFFNALKVGILPSVSFLKAPAFQDAHPGNSDPLDEQTFVVSVINALQKSSFWDSTAVVIAYDDSDGWYDHVMPPIVNQSKSSEDMLTGTGACGDGTATALPGGLPGSLTHAQGRCGYGPRLPILVISPWARENFVDHTILDQTSIIHFIEDNWLDSQRIGNGSFDAISNSIESMFDFDHEREDCGLLILDPTTGLVKGGRN
jgi:phospholipase C